MFCFFDSGPMREFIPSKKDHKGKINFYAKNQEKDLFRPMSCYKNVGDKLQTSKLKTV